jgi:hypothetical protein
LRFPEAGGDFSTAVRQLSGERLLRATGIGRTL